MRSEKDETGNPLTPRGVSRAAGRARRSNRSKPPCALRIST